LCYLSNYPMYSITVIKLHYIFITTPLLIYLKISENTYPERCENSNQKLFPVLGATTPYK